MKDYNKFIERQREVQSNDSIKNNPNEKTLQEDSIDVKQTTDKPQE